ncbi:hypothetical protein BFP72_07215 [Reichenbachiella sp. 5M10]|uniref:tetratricopeptide repeat-containing sensor histidine kinase n=1 Tax=Reichenbachiella sp. 5M10 TaxID=1889772 RepID=UPI000C36FD09|nr:ATP-binding protein [Reichenbachiella sp. 5M10]PIB35198.1 hypothetical protein BFP72_07215 [Reichenbachiella sp. 5M10]
MGELYSNLSVLPEDTSKVEAIFDILQASPFRESHVELAKQAYYLSHSLDYSIGIAKSAYHLGVMLREKLDYKTSYKNLMIALKNAKAIGDKSLMVDVLHAYGNNKDRQNHIDSAFWYYHEALRLADSIDYPYRLAEIHYSISGLSNHIGQNDKALQHILEAEAYYEGVGKGKDCWHVLNLLGIIFEESANQSRAFEYYFDALDMAKESQDRNAEVIVSNNLAILYELVGKLTEAKEFLWAAIQKAHVVGLKEDEAYLLSNIAAIYIDEKDTLRAMSSLQKSLSMMRDLNDKCEIAYPMVGLGDLYLLKTNFDSAQWYYEQSVALANECQNSPLLASAYRSLGVLCINQGKYNSGISNLKKSLDVGRQVNLLEEQKKTFLELYQAYKKKKDVVNALFCFEKYQQVRDSLLDEVEMNEIAKVTSEYEFRKKLQNLEYKRKSESLKLQAEVSKQETDKLGLYAVIALTLILAVSLYRAYFLVQNQNKRLKIINDEKNTLMGVVAHDLRSPLNNIKSIMSLVRLDNAIKGEHGEDYAQILDDSVDNMREMIDRVMDISAIEEMRLNLKMERSDVGQLLERVADNYEFIASKKEISIKRDFESKMYFARIDTKYALQVFDNLMSNAIKYSNPRSQIELSIQIRNGGGVCVSFRDEGQGISELDQTKLFVKYQKLSARPTGNEESTGLGLFIVKKFVDAMGGDVTCQSVLGQGSTFVVKFPEA